ncbi:MAG TPA: non-canonical purine NTP pyrophosphatase [Deltaproteobacteria bacterium]|nr:MAG: non-canonical purine NTP pyrophosphatase, RdgB/HAM1 family [Deltaproteobacteria bacterium GWA2_45_12]HBF12707.1 non-canonical purine NTP pyrophosphatase [Deltaproteobacteria bacterium]
MILTLATRNAGKIREIKELLKDLPFEIKSTIDFKQIGSISETGSTFQENALIKARTVHKIVGGYVLADDSGLECNDLNGSPGVGSAYFAGPHATDDENNQKLIQEMKQVHDPSRLARYVCVLALIDPQGKETLVEETCEGLISFVAKGEGGFGYDPYFFLPDYGMTMAQLPLDEKNRISHRGKALMRLKKYVGA